MGETYIYGVARIRAKEMNLLDASFMEQLLSAPDENSAVRMLRDRGWGDDGDATDAMLSKEEERTWDLMRELVSDMSVFDVFRLETDFHNLKAAVKESLRGGEHPGIFIQKGTIPAEKIEDIVQRRAYSELPESMASAAEEAVRVLLETRDGQLCDTIIDRAAMQAIRQAGLASKSRILALFGESTAAVGDIRVAVRGMRTGKDLTFMNRAMAACSTLDISELSSAAAAGQDALYAYLKKTPYAGAVPELQRSSADFERWCDDVIIDAIRPERFNSFGIDPLAAFILARRYEIRSVRIILTAKHNSLPADEIRGRIRKTYV